ncbi:hypothetical protein F4777DRAFT_600227 [Nemania sp. FL0916]|nr:hypothetical protein F4777DRAFT_600227 [Nemania sp. FL0916]
MAVRQGMSFKATCRRCSLGTRDQLVASYKPVREANGKPLDAMAVLNIIGKGVAQISRHTQLLQRRHSDAESRPDRLDLSSKHVALSVGGGIRGDPKVLVPQLAHEDKGLANASGFSQFPAILDIVEKRPCNSRKHTDASAAAAHWVACQASLVSTHDETTSPPQSQPTQSTHSQAGSIASIATTPGSPLPALQSMSLSDHDGLKPLAMEEIDPASFDLVAPPEVPEPQYSAEVKSELLLSVDHLKIIFDDPKHTQKFSDFLYAQKPESVPLLNYYLNLVKAQRAIGYADAIIRELASMNRTPSSELALTETIGKSLMGRAEETFGVLAQEELPAYITHVWTKIVNATIRQRITNTLPPNLRELSEGLAQVFCLTDPSRDDNPIVFASQEFHRSTQYGRRFALGRNCRFLQGPKTNQHSVHRFREMLVVGKEHCEPLLNYRRDGSVFMNLLMITPLYDNRGNIRYHLGAQVDVSGLLRECAGLASLGELVAQKQLRSEVSPTTTTTTTSKRKSARKSRSSRDALGDLAELFTLGELKTVQASGEMIHETHVEKPNSVGSSASTNHSNKLLQSLTKDEGAPTEETAPAANSVSSSALTPLSTSSSSLTSRPRSILDHYLLVRPFPSMKILFASPSLRVPGILQSPFMSRIGGPPSIRDAIVQAIKDGDGITTKVKWLARPIPSSGSGSGSGLAAAPNPTHGRSRWIHATPLHGVNGAVGVWVVILIDDEEKQRVPAGAPPVELFNNLERRRPFDVDFVAADNSNLDSSGIIVDTKSASEDPEDEARLAKPRSRFVEHHEELEGPGRGPGRAAGTPRNLEAGGWI